MRLLYKDENGVMHTDLMSSAYAEGTCLMFSTENLGSDVYCEIELGSEHAVEEAIISLAKNGYFDARAYMVEIY